jgi:hypothetical protein
VKASLTCIICEAAITVTILCMNSNPMRCNFLRVHMGSAGTCLLHGFMPLQGPKQQNVMLTRHSMFQIAHSWDLPVLLPPPAVEGLPVNQMASALMASAAKIHPPSQPQLTRLIPGFQTSPLEPSNGSLRTLVEPNHHVVAFQVGALEVGAFNVGAFKVSTCSPQPLKTHHLPVVLEYLLLMRTA